MELAAAPAEKGKTISTNSSLFVDINQALLTLDYMIFLVERGASFYVAFELLH
jgi:hypothetical protein